MELQDRENFDEKIKLCEKENYIVREFKMLFQREKETAKRSVKKKKRKKKLNKGGERERGVRMGLVWSE